MEWMSPVVNFLKIRASWGSIGDQTVRNSLYLPVMNITQSFWIGGNNARSYIISTPPPIDGHIQWQDIIHKNIGIDAGLFNNKINLAVDLYRRNTNNMLVPQEGMPFTLGVNAPTGNYGSLQTRGWDISLGFNHRFENGLGINISGTLSDAKTYLMEYGTGTLVNGNYNGKLMGEIWGFRTDRLYQMSDFELGPDGKPQLITLTAAESALYAGQKAYKLKPGADGKKPVYQTFLQTSDFYFGPGDVKFKDVNGDGEINRGSASLADHGDLEVIGNSNPRYEYGFRLGADYKGFDFSVFFQGVGSRQIWGNGSLAIPGFNPNDGAMPEAIAGNFWTPDNTGAFYPAAMDNGNSNTTNNMQIQDRYLLNMAYVRLKNLTVGYTLPQHLVKQVQMSSARVYVGLENFITWDHLKGLPLDPETISGYSMWDTSNYNSGRTGLGTPAFKSVSFGLQINF
jgi:hypothetical protein